MNILAMKTGVTMKKLVSISALLATLALLSGCPAKKPDVPPAPPAPTTDTAGVTDPNATVGDTDTTAGPPGELLSKRIIYFDFDRSDIRADSQSIVAAHAAYLAKNPAQKVRLEGHADERGSREYNIGLGERRGQAVRRALALSGVAETQLSTVSYGEERPAAAGSDEQAYSLNRRVEIVYLK
jgi:peptidoglycan-associated lipoprotein